MTGRRIERSVAAVALSLPLMYLLTDRSIDPLVWRYSARLLGAIVLYASAAALFIWSYRRRLPPGLETARTFATILLATAIIGLVVSELTLRALDPMPYRETDNTGRHEYDPDVGHVYVPNHEQTLQTREWRQEWRSNAQGVRADVDFGPKPPGTKRILVIGDSFTVGDQVSVDSTYPGVLQRLLDEHYGPGRFEVVNAGFPSYGTVHEARYLAKFGRRFEPDLVVLGMTPNDLLENTAPGRVIAYEGALIRSSAKDQYPVWRERRQWWSLPGHVERSMVMEALRNARRASKRYTHHRAFAVEPDSAADALYELAEGYVSDARASAMEMGAGFAIITIPFREQLSDMGPDMHPETFAKRWRAFSEAEGIPFADAYPAFRDHPEPESLYWVEDGHCTAAGYDAIARTLFDLLVRNETALDLEAGADAESSP